MAPPDTGQNGNPVDDGAGGDTSGSAAVGTAVQRSDASSAGDGAATLLKDVDAKSTTASLVDNSTASADADVAAPLPSSTANDPPSQPKTPPAPFLQRSMKLALRGVRSVTLWTIFGIITTFFFTVPSGLSAWQTLVGASAGLETLGDQGQLGHLDPSVAMVCLEFAEHPIVRQSGQCADVSLADLQALSIQQGRTTPASKSFEDFAVVREIPRSAAAYSEARKWPARSIGPWVQWPVLATGVPGAPGAELPAASMDRHYKEWATQVRKLYIPITHYLLVCHEEEWQFQSAATFFSPRGIFDAVWDGYLFSLASLSTDQDCLDCLHAPVPLVSLKHPYNITLQRKEEDNPLLQMEALDCEELYRWGSNQQWRRECKWPGVYQNLEKLRAGGYLDRKPSLSLDELGKVVREEGWEWRTRPYV